uniref:KTSC domain-containing protein n=1 Tax=Strongyloides papillosus TaxID=174720 RepID=A0A0N5BYY0_STREA
MSTNFTPEVVIDRGCKKADYTEFCIQVHRSLLGTSEIYKYSAIANDCDATLLSSYCYEKGGCYTINLN